MKHDVYEIQPDQNVDPLLEQMRDRISQAAGVTLAGNRLTVRWRDRGYLREVHMVILEVDDGEEVPQSEDPAE